ncbi:MAG: hypothetical protein GY854_00220 [Deltaproteobacteria bacterium]|nr:hypothetical protein [Deltaproteobacteria bacterium]
MPHGFTAESFRAFLLDKIDTGIAIPTAGGVNMVAATMDEVLVFTGDLPKVDIVRLTQDKLDELGVVPGDETPESTPLHRQFYDLYVDPHDVDTNVPLSGDTGIFWGETGSGLVYGRETYISIKGATQGGYPLYFRLGYTCFDPSLQAGHPCQPVLLPARKSIKTVTTKYAGFFTIWAGTMPVYIWLVWNPTFWTNHGEDLWDTIQIKAGEDSRTYFNKIEQIEVVHNDKKMIEGDKLVPSVLFDEPTDFIDLTTEIWERRMSLVHHITHPTVVAAVSDYAQGASKKYPVFDIDFAGHAVPRGWCTEFASWVFQEGATNAGYPGFFGPSAQGGHGGPDGIPIAGGADPDWGNDLSVKEMWDWLADVVARSRYYGGALHTGPTNAEWAGMATDIKAGDYVAWHECEEMDNSTTPPTCADRRAHSMVVVGWLAYDKSDVWEPQDAAQGKNIVDYFDASRQCNWLLAVSGNKGSIPGAHGLGSIVKVHDAVVCREPVQSSGSWVDPPCDINGDGVNESCDIRLWDTSIGVESDGTDIGGEAGFFGDMQYP